MKFNFFNRHLSKITNKLFIGVVGFVCFLLISCSNTTEPDEYVNYLDRFFTFSQKGSMLTNDEILSTSKRGFADFTGDGIEDMFEITEVDLSEIVFKLRLFEGYVNPDTKILNFLDPYDIEILSEEEIKARKKKINKKKNDKKKNKDVILKAKENIINWGDYLKFDTADVNGDGFADIVLSEYSDNWGDDEFNLIVSLNIGHKGRENKIAFRWMKDIEDHKAKVDFTQTFLKYLSTREAEQKDLCIGNNCSIRDRFMLNWSDMDGNGTDDLVVFWRDSRDDPNLLINVFYTNASVPSDIFQRLIFSSQDDFFLPSIFIDDFSNFHVLSKIHVDDFNGDGFDDFVIVAEKSNEKVMIKFAINTSSLRRYDGVSFMTDATTMYPDIDWNVLTEVSDQIDMMDINFDGCADYAHIGEASFFPKGQGGKEMKKSKIMYYMLTDCKAAKSVLKRLAYTEDLTGVKWPIDRVPNEQETVEGLNPSVVLKKSEFQIN